jgi:SAM-dependent methyltransferase
MLTYTRLKTIASDEDYILDVGTDTGKYLSDVDGYCVGLDLAVDPSIDSVAYINGDGATLPFNSNSFDYAVSNMVFEHVPHVKKQRLIGEVVRVLKSDGEFFISFPNRLTPIEGHNLPLRTLYLPRRLLVPLSAYLLERDEYYRASIHNITSIEARRMLERAFGSVEFHTIELASDFGQDHESWQPIEPILPVLELVGKTPAKRAVEWIFPYTCFRCSFPSD